MFKKVVNKNNIILAIFVLIILVGVVMIVVSSKTIKSPSFVEKRAPIGAEPGGLVLSQQECVSRGGRVADTTKGDRCVGNEKAISSVTGFYAPALCCVLNQKSGLTQEEAFDLAQNTEVCTSEGDVTDFEIYNPSSNTWWFSINSQKSGCKPACVVSDETSEVDINWRCTGLLIPKDEDVNIQDDTVKQCDKLGGDWISIANECEGVSKESCTSLGGTFDECGSACRNNPEAEVCTLQCVPYCSL